MWTDPPVRETLLPLPRVVARQTKEVRTGASGCVLQRPFFTPVQVLIKDAE